MKKYKIIQQDDNLRLLEQDSGALVEARTLLHGGTVFCFAAAMGVGKTTLIKQICKEMGVRDIVNSPTFSIVNEYTTTEEKKFFHMDLYRIKNLAELYDIGFEEYLFSGDLCLIEWPEIAEPLLPNDAIMIKMYKENNDRFIEIFE